MKRMKSNDYHVMMQTILPLCMRHFMVKGCRMTIIRLSHVFEQLCAKIIDLIVMGELKKNVTITVVLLEWEFPPSFFDIMTHLLIHLVEELELCGSVHTQWTYLIKRYFKTLKGFMRNRTRLEGRMEKGYALEKALGFFIEYL